MSPPIPLLLIDDSVSNLLVMSALLEDEGFRVASAETAEEARAVVQTGELPDVVIVDRNLGEEDGILLAAELRGALPSASIFMYSGDPPEIERMEGIDGWILKGTPVDELVEQVRTSLKSKDPREA